MESISMSGNGISGAETEKISAETVIRQKHGD